MAAPVIVREPLPDHKTVIVTPPGGAPVRWAEDEPSPVNVLEGLTYGDEMPGGYRTLSGSLGRRPDHIWRDTEAFGNVKVFGSDLEEEWDGRLDQAPQETGTRLAISPEAVGWQAAFDDGKVKAGYISSDLDRWNGRSATARAEILDAGVSPHGGEVDVDAETGLPGLRLSIEGTWTTRQDAEMEFDCGAGLRATALLFDWLTKSAIGGQPDLNFMLQGRAADSDSDVGTGEELGADLHTVDQSTGSGGFAPSRAYRVLGARWRHDAGPGADGHTFDAILRRLLVMGEDAAGMVLAGTADATRWGGLLAKPMLTHLINTHTALTTRDELIDDDDFPIPDAWFAALTTPGEIAKSLMRYRLYDWFVFGNREFQRRVPGTHGKYWRAYAGPSGLTEAGVDSTRLWESIVIEYQDTDGTTRSVGPPGAQVDYPTEELRIDDPDHPAVKANLTRRDILQLRGIGSTESAIAAGSQFLEEAHLLNRAGSATLSGYVLDDRGVFWPVSRMKSGDLLAFVDAADPSYRKIVQKEYTHEGRTSQIELDAPPKGLEELLERLQAVLVPLGLG